MKSKVENNPDWFRDAAFGMFIHWGLYAIPAGIWNSREAPGESEWIMSTLKIPIREYEQLARRFNPIAFDARQWVTLAKDAGMKYIIVTAKHHDGFAMFHSRCNEYNIVDATPFGRDPLTELAEACADIGMKLGFYYSHDQDWHESGGSGNYWDFIKKEKNSVEKVEGDIIWPSKWRVFGPYAKDDELPSEEALNHIPERICLSDKDLSGEDVVFCNGYFDFDQMLGFGSGAEKRFRTAYAFTSLYAEEEKVVTMGAGADWWMQWWLDGKLVADTYKNGGGCGNAYKPIAVTNHVFNLKLLPGKHTLVLRFLRGAGENAKVAVGGPRELRTIGWTPVRDGINAEKAFAEYLEQKVKPQVRELLTKYGPVAIMWFDTPNTITPEQSRDLRKYVRSLQPDCLVNGRIGHGMGDYECLSDNQLPPDVLTGTWEGLGTTNHSWGYKFRDKDWKSTQQVLQILIEHAAKNANYILNVGPDADGKIPVPASENLRSAGEWLKINGEAIYGAQAVRDIPKPSWGYITRKGQFFYLFITGELPKNNLEFDFADHNIKSACLLSNKLEKLHISANNKVKGTIWKINIPETVSISIPCVIAVETDYT